MIATKEPFIHSISPILLAYPRAWTYSFSKTGTDRVEYTGTEHYRVTKSFLDRRGQMLHMFLSEEEADLRRMER